MKSLSSSSSSHLKRQTRLFSLLTTADAPGDSVDSGGISNYTILAHDEQQKPKFMDKIRHKSSSHVALQLGESVNSREHGVTKASGFSLVHSRSSLGSLEECVRVAVEFKNYQKLPEILNTSKGVCQNPNPFSFLSIFSVNHRTHVIDEILQSLIPIRPCSRPHAVYSYLLSYILESQNPLPLGLAIIQRILRSGCLPVPQTHLSLSKAWVERRQMPQSVLSILLEMDSIGYPVDCGTCNYLILSLCKIDQFEEAMDVLHGMGKACVPDLDSYGILISEMSEIRKTNGVVEMMKEMVGQHGLSPRKETILKALGAMRANRDIWKAAGMIEYLESQGVHVGFEGYELALEGCVESRQFVLGGKLAIRMGERGFIPYMKVRQRVVEGLVGIGNSEMASIVRQMFARLRSS